MVQTNSSSMGEPGIEIKTQILEELHGPIKVLGG
jgi:hypothetical protein